MNNRQHQQTVCTKALNKGKNNNKEVYRQMAHFRVIVPTTNFYMVSKIQANLQN